MQAQETESKVSDPRSVVRYFLEYSGYGPYIGRLMELQEDGSLKNVGTFSDENVARIATSRLNRDY